MVHRTLYFVLIVHINAIVWILEVIYRTAWFQLSLDVEHTATLTSRFTYCHAITLKG